MGKNERKPRGMTVSAQKFLENKALVEEAKKRAPEVLARIFAEEIRNQIEGRDFVPNQEVTDKLRALVNRGMTIKDMRVKYFSSISQPIWEKIIKHMFRDQVANEESLGLSLVQSQQSFKKALNEQLKDIRKDMKAQRKKGQVVSMQLRRMESDLLEKIFKLDSDMAAAMLKLGVVGDASKSASVHVHFEGIPRPKQKDVVEVK